MGIAAWRRAASTLAAAGGFDRDAVAVGRRQTFGYLPTTAILSLVPISTLFPFVPCPSKRRWFGVRPGPIDNQIA
jgi:hypothetical protein